MDIMEHGEWRVKNDMCRALPNRKIASEYYKNVFLDYAELREYYPFTKLFVPPTTYPREIKIVLIAVGRDLIEALLAKPEDFTGVYSKVIEVGVPYNYRAIGCSIYGGAWINFSKFRVDDWHILGVLDDGRYSLCVGTPSSYCAMKNVILECVRTADNYLVAYEKLQKGISKKLELISYSHGEAGIKEYGKDKKRYRTK